MFHITFVECLSAEHLKKSRWVFVSYLSLISLCVLAIAWVGNILFFDSPVNGDTYVIALPLMKDLPWLATAAFIGGFSAATAMIIVATMTLSQMLSNDVILPLLMHHRKNKRLSNDFTRSLIISRRLNGTFRYHWRLSLSNHPSRKCCSNQHWFDCLRSGCTTCTSNFIRSILAQR